MAVPLNKSLCFAMPEQSLVALCTRNNSDGFCNRKTRVRTQAVIYCFCMRLAVHWMPQVIFSEHPTQAW